MFSKLWGLLALLLADVRWWDYSIHPHTSLSNLSCCFLVPLACVLAGSRWQKNTLLFFTSAAVLKAALSLCWKVQDFLPWARGWKPKKAFYRFECPWWQLDLAFGCDVVRVILQWNCRWRFDGLSGDLSSSGLFCQGWNSKCREWNRR